MYISVSNENGCMTVELFFYSIFLWMEMVKYIKYTRGHLKALDFNLIVRNTGVISSSIFS